MNTKAIKDTWIQFQCEHHPVSIDRMLCSPSYRQEFLGSVRLVVDEQDEEAILWALLQLRKRKAHSKELR